jgi:hypothetical protein
MGLLALGGAFAGGFSQGFDKQQEMAIKDKTADAQIAASQAQVRASDSAIALNNIKLKEWQEEQQRLDQITEVPIAPGTETHKFLMNYAETNKDAASTFKHDEKTGMTTASVRDIERFKKNLMSSRDMQKAMWDVQDIDDQNEIANLTKIVNTQAMPDGTKVSGKALEEVQAKLAAAKKGYLEGLSMRHAAELLTAQSKAGYKSDELTPFGVDKSTKQPVWQNKRGEFMLTGGEPFKGNPANIVPNSRLNAEATRTVVTIQPDRAQPDHRSPEEKNYDRAQKDPKFKEFLEFYANRKKQTEESPIGVRPKITN